MVSVNFWLSLIAIVILSLVMNWGVQFTFYLWSKWKNPNAFKGQKTLLNYFTGYLGDGVIAPLINILIFYEIVKIGPMVNWTIILSVYGVGLVLDFLAHYCQGKLKLTNWSMPTPFKWNFAGYWHMFSFPIQIAYLVYFFWFTFVNWQAVWAESKTALSVTATLALMLLFVTLYVMDEKVRLRK